MKKEKTKKKKPNYIMYPLTITPFTLVRIKWSAKRYSGGVVAKELRALIELGMKYRKREYDEQKLHK